MDRIANAIWGADPAPAQSAAAKPMPASNSVADRMWPADLSPAAQPRTDGRQTPSAAEREAAQHLADGAHIDPAARADIAVGLAEELDAAGLQDPVDRRLVLREIGRRVSPAEARQQLADSMSWLRARYKDEAPAVLAQANAFLRKASPNLAQAITASGAGNNVEVIRMLVGASQAARRKR